MLAHILSIAGHYVGLAVDGRAFSAGRESGLRRASPPEAARAILFDLDVDMAVFELKPNEILLHGLDQDPINHAVIVNPVGPTDGNGTRASRRGADALDAMRVVVRATNNTVYVRDDNDLAAAITHGIAIP